MTKEQLDIVKHLLNHAVYHYIIMSPPIDIISLAKYGAIVATDDTDSSFKFPAPAVAYCAAIAFSQQIPRPVTDQLQTIWQLLQITLRNFNPSTIKASLNASAGADGHPLEVMWCMEFYRCASTCVSKDTFISPSARATGVDNKDGWVDFVVNTNKWWLIEFVREDNDVTGHIQRFQRGGNYYSMLTSKNNGQWAVVNFRHSNPTQVHPNLYSVVYNSDLSYFTIFNNSTNPIGTIMLNH